MCHTLSPYDKACPHVHVSAYMCSTMWLPTTFMAHNTTVTAQASMQLKMRYILYPFICISHT